MLIDQVLHVCVDSETVVLLCVCVCVSVCVDDLKHFLSSVCVDHAILTSWTKSWDSQPEAVRKVNVMCCMFWQDLARGLQDLLEYDGDVEEDFGLTFQVSGRHEKRKKHTHTHRHTYTKNV